MRGFFLVTKNIAENIFTNVYLSDWFKVFAEYLDKMVYTVEHINQKTLGLFKAP